MINNNDLDILEKFPFLSYVSYNNEKYLGIISNSDNLITTMYVFSEIRNSELKHLFLEYGDEWWWQTSREVPINIIFNHKWNEFEDCKKTFITKALEILKGSSLTLDNFTNKKIKRKQINLLKINQFP